MVRGVISRHEQFRRGAGYSVTAFARALDPPFSHAYVSRVESGHLRPSARYRLAAARLLQIPEHYIFGEDSE